MTADLLCPVCGSFETRLLFDSSQQSGWRGVSGGPVRLCGSCGSGFVAGAMIRELTPSLVVCDPTAGINPLWVVEAEAHRRIWRRRLDWIEGFIERPARLLDVGCYNGLFLDEAKRRGWSCKGVEPDAAATRWAREQLGLDVVCGRVGDLAVGGPTYDIVTMFHVLEHVQDGLVATLEEIRLRLADDGLLVIETPDCAPCLRILRRRFRYVQPDHLYYFSRGGIVQLLARAGYRIRRINHTGKDTSIRNVFNWLAFYLPWMARVGGALRPRLADTTIYLNLGDIMLVAARPAYH